MQPEQRQQLEQQLHQRIGELHSLLEPVPADHGDEERAEQAVGEALLAKARRELLLLERNLEWLDSDDAGLCDNCGEPIPLPRLLAVPSTRQCVGCAASSN